MLGIVLPTTYLLLEALLEVRSGGNGSHRHVRTKKRAKERTTAVEEDEGDGGSMAHIKDDFDASIAQDTVFDWGFSRDSLRSGDGSSAPAAGGGGGGAEAPGSKAAAGPQRAPSSRYDPKAMSRIVDITDLVDDSDDDDSDSGDFESVGVPRSGTSSRSTRGGRGGDGGWGSQRVSRASRGRLMLALTAVAAVVVSGAIAITYVILYPQDFKAALRPSKMGEGSSQGARQQLMLELAERVTLACDVSGGGGDLNKCWDLCEERECCFFDEDDDDGTSCADDEDMDCGAYGGCWALVEGTPYDGAEEEEERMRA